jgi:glycosyltransferase involved in cell wall biosynthesis
MARLSVIVPVYKSELYIADCLDSLQAQTFADIEVVCVSDGSPDRSCEIVRDYAAADARVTLVEKENGGPSSARNVGIRSATSELVCFLDADDTFTSDACERIVAAFDSGSYDVVVFGGNCLPREGADRRIVDALSPQAADYPVFDPALLFRDRTHPYIRFAMRRGFLLDNGLLFDEELRVGEEEALVFNVFPAAHGVKVIPDKLYNYVQFHEGSQMDATTASAERQCTTDQGVAEHVFRDCRQNGVLAAYPAELIWWSVRFSAYSVLRQDPAVRNPLLVRVRRMWLDWCTDDELAATSARPSLARLVAIVLDADDGAVAVSEGELARALRAWRLEEYGALDAARTLLERVLP